MAGSGQFSWSPMSPSSATGHAFSRSATVSDFRRLSRQLTPEPSPQAWLASSKRRVGVLDPPASPLEMLSPITEPLDASQWNKRMSLLTHRYLIEYGIDREEEIVEKAFRTLELFCVGNEAKESLENFKFTFARLSTTSLEQHDSYPLEKSSSWISFPSFLDDSFNLSHTSLSLDQKSLATGTLSDITQDANNRSPQALSHNFVKRSSIHPLENPNIQNSEPNTTMSGGPRPRYMTPTLASKAQNSTSQPQSRPTTPASAISTTEKRNWMANAGRRLGITTPKSRREGRVLDSSSTGRCSPEEATIVSKKSQTKDKSNNAEARKTAESLSPDVKPDAFNIHRDRLNRQREHTAPPRAQSGIPHPQPKESSPDKPLPSLPVATIRPRSPIVRRSLIDASEKPLRRSLSPSPGVEAHEDWLAILPSRPTSPKTLQSLAQRSSVNFATMDEEQRQNSLTKAQGSLKTKTDNENSVQARNNDPNHSASVLWGADFGAASASDTASVNEEERATGGGETHTSTGMQDVSAGAVSMANSGHGQQPRSDWQPRQTKTSMMRARLSSGSNDMAEKERKNDSQATSPHHFSPYDHSPANASAIPIRLSIPGPVRSRSHSRQAVSARNTPYGLANQVTGQVVNSNVNLGRLSASPDRRKPFGKGNMRGLPDLRAVKQASASGTSTRKSHIPVRRQSKDSEPDESEGDVLVKKSAKHVSRKDEDKNSGNAEDADVDTDQRGSSAHHKVLLRNADIRLVEGEEIVSEPEVVKSDVPCSSPEPRDLGGATTVEAGNQPSTTTLSSTAFEEDESLSLNSQNDSEIVSLRDFAATEPTNYRVKRLSLAAPEHGPTLRISEEAEKILMGAHSEEENVGEELGTLNKSSTSDLRKSTVIKEQFKASKERILKGQLPLSRSTTSRSLSKLKTEPNPLTASESSASDAGAAGTDDAIAGSQANGSQLARSIGDEDPFIFGGRLPLGGQVAEHSLLKDDEWPLRCAEAPHPDLKTVSERASEEEDSWISPLATAITQTNEVTVTPTFKVPNDTPAMKDIRDLQKPLNGVPEVWNRPTAATKNPSVMHDTTTAEGHSTRPFPARVSSRTQFQELIQDRSDKDRPVLSHQSTSPRIPNRFASVRSTGQSKAISTTPASFSHTGTASRFGYNMSTSGASSLPERRAPDSAKAQLSATKGMLSNFRGLFQKRSLENTNAVSKTSNNVSVRRKNAVAGQSGIPFPFVSPPVSSKPLSAGPSRRNAQVTPTPNGIGGDRATNSISSASLTPESGEAQDAARLARQVLDSAVLETNAPKRAKLVQLGQLMVHAVTASKDAEKAVEEARQAAAMAEVHSMDAKRCLWHVSEMVETMLKD